MQQFDIQTVSFKRCTLNKKVPEKITFKWVYVIIFQQLIFTNLSL